MSTIYTRFLPFLVKYGVIGTNQAKHGFALMLGMASYHRVSMQRIDFIDQGERFGRLQEFMDTIPFLPDLDGN